MVPLSQLHVGQSVVSLSILSVLAMNGAFVDLRYTKA
ncbi:MAG: hypothetical protein QOF58_5989, partial [Pseudonocardiales bacterium]|nr:hypothetical protein [Pseudonocardiales bacterium]